MSDNKTTYIGLTIGPIYKTLGAARKTIELWAASYVFSHLMKKIVAAVLKQDASYKAIIINPLADANKGEGSAGLYPDRLILESHGEKDFDLTLALVNKEVQELGERIARCFTSEKEATDKIAASVANYLQTYLVEVPAEGLNENPLFEVNQHLDTAELQTPFKANDPDMADYLILFIQELRNSATRKHLIQLVFEVNKVPDIESLEEIALSALKANLKEEWLKVEKLVHEKPDSNYIQIAKAVFNKKYLEEKAKYEAVKRQNKASELTRPQNAMKKHHSYIAIIHADGDNVGDTIKQLGTTDGYQRFCAGLMNYSEESIIEISKFGGLPIYAGGDDLLFFAPIEGKGDDHIFQLLERLDGIFSKHLKVQVDELNEGLIEKIKLPTLSFGLSISYYKFPLYEALETSRHLLFGKAKKREGKNAIALKIQLHSGHSMSKEFSLRKSGASFADPTYRHLRQMMGESLKQENLRLNSVTFALDKNRTLLGTIGGDENRMSAFFDNSFNEDIHKPELIKDAKKAKALEGFWKTVQALLVDSYALPEVKIEKAKATTGDIASEKEHTDKANKLALENAESVLRILHFLNQANDEQ